MDNEKQEDIEQRLLRKVYTMVVAGSVVAGGVGSLGLVRVNSFDSHDAELMRSRIMIEVQKVQMECQAKIAQSEATKPPGLTRQRIRALEKSAERTDPGYEQPTWEWQ